MLSAQCSRQCPKNIQRKTAFFEEKAVAGRIQLRAGVQALPAAFQERMPSVMLAQE